jgi:hypothetical protein
MTSAQIIPPRPHLMPLKGSPLSRPDIRWLTLRDQLDECDRVEMEINDKLGQYALMERKIRDERMDLFKTRSKVRALRNKAERDLEQLLDKYPDCGEGP